MYTDNRSLITVLPPLVTCPCPSTLCLIPPRLFPTHLLAYNPGEEVLAFRFQ
jgi:hypothetical protein